MLNFDRFKFIGHALRGDGPFRPTITYDATGNAINAGSTYLVQYPRESDEKFARRNAITFYASPLMGACMRFVGYLMSREPLRELTHPLYEAIADDADGKGNNIDVFWQQFAMEAKARGSMLLLVDMPNEVALNQADQIERRVAPYLTAIYPEQVKDYQLNDAGQFAHVSFMGNVLIDGQRVDCTWYFDAAMWQCTNGDGKVLAQGEHMLGQCPVLIFTERGDFPCYGSFAPIADLSKRVFNLESELDEILRSQTFSLLTLQVPDDSTSEQKLDAARVAGETIGTANLMVHSGSTPAFIAPADGPARVYMDRIKAMQEQIDVIGLNVATVNQQESGIAMQARFHSINSELASFAAQMEDLERRAWDLAARWLRLNAQPVVTWSRDFDIADVQMELAILTQMQTTGMPQAAITEQMRRIAGIQFGNSDDAVVEEIHRGIDEYQQADDMRERTLQEG